VERTSRFSFSSFLPSLPLHPSFSFRTAPRTQTHESSHTQKLRAQPGDPQYHKLAVLVPSLAYLEPVANLHDYRPAEVYFHKPRGDPGVYSAVKVVPHEKPLVQNFDALEFLTRNMFVTRANLWHKALAYVPYPTFTFSLLPLSD
jgi:hypothetical protein